jgi:hypothetical protein
VASVFVPFDGWSPSPGYFGEGWNAVRNLYPAYNAWRPWRKFMPAAGEVADGPMVGRHTHVWSTGAGSGAYYPDPQTIYCGSTSRLYTVDPATGNFTNISRAAPYTADVAGWRFVSVGNDIWATNWIDALQRRTNNAGNFADGLTGAFKPRPRFIAVVRQHLVWANDSTGRQDDWGWSDADNATDMNPPTGTSTSIAGRPAPLISVPGQITGLIGGQYGFAFKESATYYLEATGTTQVFRPEELSTTVGTIYPSSIIKTRHGVFFLGGDGFYRIAGLSEPQKISPPGIDQVLLDSAFTTFTYGFFTWQEDTQIFGFQSRTWPIVGWVLRLNWLEHGNSIAILHNPLTGAWALADVADPNPEEGLAARPTVIVERRYAASPYDGIAALTWDGSVSKYAPLSSSGANVRAPSMALNFRPLNRESSANLAQTRIARVLPVFSKTSLGGAALTPQVTVEPMLDPFAGLSAAGAEAMLAANRSPIDGSYPFERAGLWARVSIQCAAEDFADFPGVWVDSELLR